eukprot:CAMPEP_0194395152 /NCGR_PEP_ID=MMETSP0174-20130528/124261_1 /TAXON_ID=216777 /ORGANISM="Proboscia alata, Strain PI-D3" /LENGTH=187 /DNA_ID=CAMNT_0039191049 /DNA_START=419 /DNA_END=979 /DNA_ORIENTATION=+
MLVLCGVLFSFVSCLGDANEFGDTLVPKTFTKNPALGHWVSNQRHSFKKSQNGIKSCGISKDQIRLLNNIGFQWSLRITDSRKYYQKFRDGESSGRMTTKETQLLNNTGFEWGLRKTDYWDSRYEELVSYAKEFGDTRVPRKYTKNLALGNWVNNQRNNFKKFQKGITSCGISTDKIQQLSNIGFEW